jgi:peptide/nickel transport system substrate-binding protein
MIMRRRDLLSAAGAGLAALAAPRIGRAERSSKLVFVPTSDLTVLDPVVTFNRPTRNYAYLVFDTLYGIDTNWAAQPQMVKGHDVEEDGLIWNLKLRDGLRFHDKEPVLARDVVASIRRFAVRIPFAHALMAATEELSAPDDRTVRFRLKRPFPHLPEARAGPGGTVPAIMPEHLAAQPRPTNRSSKSSAAAPIASSPKSMSAALAPPSSALRSTSRDRVAPSASLPDRRSHILIGSSG